MRRMGNGTHSMVCVPCRVVTRAVGWTGGNGSVRCPHCGKGMAGVSSKWRAPRRDNDAAWRRIAAGEWLWDRKAASRCYTPWVRPTPRNSRGKVPRQVANSARSRWALPWPWERQAR